jgi:hypothetical protein
VTGVTLELLPRQADELRLYLDGPVERLPSTNLVRRGFLYWSALRTYTLTPLGRAALRAAAPEEGGTMLHRFTVEVELVPGLENALCALHSPADWTVPDLTVALLLCRDGRGGNVTIRYEQEEARVLAHAAHPPEGALPPPTDLYRRVATVALALDGPTCAVAKDRAARGRPWLEDLPLADVLAIYDKDETFLLACGLAPGEPSPNRVALVLAKLGGESVEWAFALASEIRPVELGVQAQDGPMSLRSFVEEGAHVGADGATRRGEPS